MDLIQDFNSSRVYFRSSFAAATNLWPTAQHVRHPLQPEHCGGTVLPLSTSTGYYCVPSIYPLHQHLPVEIASLTLHTTFENLTYATAPFLEHDFRQVEAVNGFISFSSTDLNVPAPSVTHPPPPPATRRIGYRPSRSRPTADLMHSLLVNETYDEQDFYIPLQVANESMLHNDFRPRQHNPPN